MSFIAQTLNSHQRIVPLMSATSVVTIHGTPFRNTLSTEVGVGVFEPKPRSCWECDRGKVLCLPCGLGEYVDCPPANWKGQSCAANLLDTIEKPFRMRRPTSLVRET